MNPDKPIGIIELGNLKLKCIIFKINEDNNSEILSTSTSKSEGIHNGVVVNLKKASDTIRSCISDAEKKAKILIKKIIVVVEQPEFLCTKLSKRRKIDGSKIKKYDIDFLLKEAKKQVTHNDENQSIIHIFNHNYIVDGKTFIEEPIDVYANFLSHEMTFITMPKNNLKNINQAFINCDIEVERFISCTFALAVNLLNANQLQSGSVLMNLDIEKTSLGLFKNLALVHSVTIPIGINHIIKDISKICSLNLKESEIICKKIDFSFENNEELFDQNGFLKDNYFNGSNYRKISKTLILDITKARLDEIFCIIKKQIVTPELNTSFGVNFFMTDEGSKFLNLEKYCSNFFGSKVNSLNKKNESAGIGDTNSNFTSCLGALKIVRDGWETEAIPELANKNAQKLSFFARFFGRET